MSVLVPVPTFTAATVPPESGTFYTGITAWNPTTTSSTTVTVEASSASERVGLPEGDIGRKVSGFTPFSLLVSLRACPSSSRNTCSRGSLLAGSTTLPVPVMTGSTFTCSHVATCATGTSRTFISKTVRIFRSWSLKTFTSRTSPCT